MVAGRGEDGAGDAAAPGAAEGRHLLAGWHVGVRAAPARARWLPRRADRGGAGRHAALASDRRQTRPVQCQPRRLRHWRRRRLRWPRVRPPVGWPE